MFIKVLKRFLDKNHGLRLRKLDEVYNEKVARANDLVDLGYVVKVSKKK